jgi:hypothetical protein
MKKKLPSGFLSNGSNPTTNAVEMFMVYFQNGGSSTSRKMNDAALDAVREHFNWFEPNSFKTMLQWGLDPNCAKSTTSSSQALAMRTAKLLGQIMAEQVIVKTKTI